jgi:Clp amino terminal domain, pathogenicity island component
VIASSGRWLIRFSDGRSAIAACDAWRMFERFTERARQVVVLAQEEARTLKHNYIGTEHILLGLLREEQGLAARVLESLDITVEQVRGQVVRIVGHGEEETPGQIPFTPRAKKVLELAQHEALSLGHNYIGTEHILLSLARVNEGVGMRIVQDFGVDTEKVRGAVYAALGGPMASRQAVSRVFSGATQILGPHGLDWQRATLLWRREGLELRIPLHLNEGAIATFAADPIWSIELLAGLRREIWSGWLALASPTLLDDFDPGELRRVLDAAAEQAADGSGRDRARAEDFLRRLRDEP